MIWATTHLIMMQNAEVDDDGVNNAEVTNVEMNNNADNANAKMDETQDPTDTDDMGNTSQQETNESTQSTSA